MSESDAYCLMRQHEEIDKLQARVAELESENAQHLEQISSLHADITRLRGWTANAVAEPARPVTTAAGHHQVEQEGPANDRNDAGRQAPTNTGAPLTPEIEAWAEGVFEPAPMTKIMTTREMVDKLNEQKVEIERLRAALNKSRRAAGMRKGGRK